MRKPWRERRMAAVELCALAIMLVGCSTATPTWGPDTPRNGAGQPVDQTFGTPIPGYPQLPK